MAVHPFFAALPLLLGLLSPVHEDLEKRIAVLTRRLQESPADAELYVQRAELHRQHQEYQASAEDLAQASRLEPENADLQLTEARLAYDLGEFQNSARRIKRLLESTSLDAHTERQARLLKAEALTALADPKPAIQAWDEVLEIHPDPDPDWYLRRSTLQRPEQALAGIEQALDRLGMAVPLVLRASAIEEGLGRFKAASTRLQSLVDAAPRKETWLTKQGDILARGGLHGEARERYQEARKRLDALPPRHRDTFSMRRLAAHLDQALAALPR